MRDQGSEIGGPWSAIELRQFVRVRSLPSQDVPFFLRRRTFNFPEGRYEDSPG